MAGHHSNNKHHHPSVARTIGERILCHFGIPEVIHSDQEAQFELAVMAELYELWSLPHTHTLHPITLNKMD